MPLRAWASVLGPDYVQQEPNGRTRHVKAADGREYVLKQPMSWDPAAPRLRLAREFRLLSHLRGAGVPVALPIVNDNGSICTESGGELYVLLARIAFDTDPPEERPDASDVFRRVGAAIARMDQALASCPFPLSSYEIVVDQRVTPGLFPRLRTADPGLVDNLDRLGPAMRAATAGLEQRLTHGDCHDGNVLLCDGQVAGFIDLDHLTTAPRIGDITRWLGTRMLWAMHAPNDRWPRFVALVDALLAGYSEVSQLSDQERTALGPVLLITQLDDAEWRLGEGDDSSSTVTSLIRACHWLADRDAELR